MSGKYNQMMGRRVVSHPRDQGDGAVMALDIQVLQFRIIVRHILIIGIVDISGSSTFRVEFAR